MDTFKNGDSIEVETPQGWKPGTYVCGSQFGHVVECPDLWYGAMSMPDTSHIRYPQPGNPFKVGDRVRIARKVETDSKRRDCEWSPGMDRLIGAVGKVVMVQVDPNDPYPCLVEHLPGQAWTWWFSPEALDRLPTEGEQ